jgi:choline dehydrogenase-like flavoprotein
MLSDLRTVEPRDLEADVCVVGCGPAGITVATELAARGVGVVVLESGDVGRERAADALGAGESVGYPYVPLARTRARGVGGTSLHWEMETEGGDEGWIARPLDPLDFEARPGVPASGWPFGSGDLARYYERAQQIAGLGPFRYSADDWTADPNPPFELPSEVVATRVFQRGHETFARYAPDLARDDRIRVLTHATSTGFSTDPDGRRVAHASVADRNGRSIRVVARRFVLASGGIENARQLLLSRGVHASGIGNEHDLVGRFFMERLSGRGGVLVPASPDLIARAGLYASHLVDGTRVQGVVGLAPEVVRREGLRNAILWLRASPRATTARGVQSLLTLSRLARRQPRSLAHVPGHVRYVARDLPDVASTILRRALRRPAASTVFQLGIQAEQAPNPDSRVTLGDARDSLGLPVARLDWRPTDDDRESIRRTIELLDDGFGRARLGRIRFNFGDRTPPSLYLGNFHHVGTTRMHADPRHGVVDAIGRVHGVSNLYVAGSSVFPTSGYANPTLTLVALAVRLAEHLADSALGDLGS